MNAHDHSHHSAHHHHHAGHVHPPAAVTPSLLRLSAAGRLAIAAALIAVIWLGVAWAIRGTMS
ncbi:MAG: hypothetical protein AB7T86_04255 [Xanthobacteraceae bacterium]|uniref:hypothetical protein n=1 Tax=Pseudolabrys sp. TaxID=1960880 RepID=UPI003D13E017